MKKKSTHPLPAIGAAAIAGCLVSFAPGRNANQVLHKEAALAAPGAKSHALLPPPAYTPAGLLAKLC